LAGDEFVVLLPEIGDPEDVGKVAHKIIEATSEVYRLDEHEIFVTTSVGICIYPGDGEDRSTLLKNADAAMYHAKLMGKNRFEFFREEMSENYPGPKALGEDLKRALNNEEFETHYQPIIALETGKVVGSEALTRWRHSSRGLLLPEEFLPAAKESNLIVPIGKIRAEGRV
jgi:predicted signal transduction protein with EAL and GGDEF domain